MPIATLAVRIWAFCASMSRADRGSLATSWGLTAGPSVEVVPENLGSGRVAQLGHRLGLDLADPLPGDPVGLADLVQGPGLAAGQPEPHGHHAGLAFGQGAEHRVQLLVQQRGAGRLGGLDGLGVLDEVAELAVAVLAERGVQRDRLAGLLLRLARVLPGRVPAGPHI